MTAINVSVTSSTQSPVSIDQIGGEDYQRVFNGNIAFTKLVDFVSDTVFYKGEALPGTLTSAASWRISRGTLDPSGDVSIQYASTGIFNQVWDNRISLTYA
jgi:hypothetical protein